MVRNMKRKTKNEKAAEDIVRSLRQDNCFDDMSDERLTILITDILKLWYKPVPRKKDDGSWKKTRDQCS